MMISKPVFLAILLLALLALHPAPASACGGPEYYDIDAPMAGPDYLLHFLNYGYDYYGDNPPKKQFSFFYPFELDPSRKASIKLVSCVRAEERDFPARPATAVLPAPSMDGFEHALRKIDFKAAHKEAKGIVRQILDMPSIAADAYQKELIRALEFLELEPYLTELNSKVASEALLGELDFNAIDIIFKPVRDVIAVRSMNRYEVEKFMAENPDNPRMPTLKFVAMQVKFGRSVPDGWADEIQKKVPADTWRELQNDVDKWLKDYPEHPLADLVRLWKNHIYHFEGKEDPAWRNLMSIYPRHLPRLLFEMQYMGRPSDEMFDTMKDPVLVTALIPEIDIKAEQWTRLWRMSEEKIKEPWAVNLQERLLLKAAELVKDEPAAKPHRHHRLSVPVYSNMSATVRSAADGLPEGFPEKPLNRTDLWGKLRAAVLIKAGKWDAAKEQILSLKPDIEQILLAETYYFHMNDLVSAAEVEGLSEDRSYKATGVFVGGWDMPAAIRNYLIRVLLNDEDLKKLESAKDETIRNEARFAEGVRLAAAGHWDNAAKLVQKIDPDRAALWRKISRLTKDGSKSSLLKLARLFKGNDGNIFYPADNAWYRTLSSRFVWVSGDMKFKLKYETDEQAKDRIGREKWTEPWTREYEREAILRDLTASEYWFALQAYVRWLEKAKPSQEMREVVKEADYCYNKLINLDLTNSNFWPQYLKTQPAEAKLRQAGKKIRVKTAARKEEVSKGAEKKKEITCRPSRDTVYVERVIVPEYVTERWKSVKFALRDRQTGVKSTHAVDIGDTLVIPGSDYKVKVAAFLPEEEALFKDNCLKIVTTIRTTKSDKLNNPSAEIVVEEKGKEVQRRWLRAGEYKYLSTYENDRFTLTFTEVIQRDDWKPEVWKTAQSEPDVLPPPPTAGTGWAAGRYPGQELPILVSGRVKAEWPAVRLSVKDKAKGVANEHVVKIGNKLKIPDLGLDVDVIAFVPSFMETANAIWNYSIEPFRPAAEVEILENGKSLFPNKRIWLQQKYPSDIFMHERFEIILLGGVRK